MPRDVRLRNDLAEDRDSNGRDRESEDACEDGVGEQREERVGGNVSPENRGQKEMEVLGELENPLRPAVPASFYDPLLGSESPDRVDREENEEDGPFNAAQAVPSRDEDSDETGKTNHCA